MKAQPKFASRADAYAWKVTQLEAMAAPEATAVPKQDKATTPPKVKGKPAASDPKVKAEAKAKMKAEAKAKPNVKATTTSDESHGTTQSASANKKPAVSAKKRPAAALANADADVDADTIPGVPSLAEEALAECMEQAKQAEQAEFMGQANDADETETDIHADAAFPIPEVPDVIPEAIPEVMAEHDYFIMPYKTRPAASVSDRSNNRSSVEYVCILAMTNHDLLCWWTMLYIQVLNYT